MSISYLFNLHLLIHKDRFAWTKRKDAANSSFSGTKGHETTTRKIEVVSIVAVVTTDVVSEEVVAIS